MAARPGAGTPQPRRWIPIRERKEGTPEHPQLLAAGHRRREFPVEGGRQGKKEKSWPVQLESAVVAINPTPGGKLTGVELIREAQQTLSLERLEVPPLQIRRSKMGGYLLGIKGQGAKEQADRLAKGLKGLPGASGVAVTRPEKRLNIRVSGLETGVPPEMVVQAVAAAGGCSAEELKPGDRKSVV